MDQTAECETIAARGQDWAAPARRATVGAAEGRTAGALNAKASQAQYQPDQVPPWRFTGIGSSSSVTEQAILRSRGTPRTTR